MRKFAHIKIAVSAVIIAAFTVPCAVNAAPRLDAVAGDFLMRRGTEMSDDIVVLTIDDASIGELVRYPWNRSVYAALLDNLSQGGAAVIAFDLLFSEESDEAADDAFMEAIAYAGNVVLAQQIDIIVGQRTELDSDGLLVSHGVIEPIAKLASQSAGIGHINVRLDDWDGYYRRALGRFRASGSGEIIKTFDEVIYELYCQTRGITPNEIPSHEYADRPYVLFADTGAPYNLASALTQGVPSSEILVRRHAWITPPSEIW